MKTCRVCREEKPLTEFTKDKRNADGYARLCRPCKMEESRRYRERNPEKRMDNHYRDKYGITLEEYREMVARQGGKCLVAGCDGEAKHLDHNHETGELRGVLCNNCNVALGMADDSPTKLRALAHYLEDRGYYG